MFVKKFFFIALFLLFGAGTQLLFSQTEEYPLIWTKEMPNIVALSDIFFTHDSQRIICYEDSSRNLLIYDINGNLISNSLISNFIQPILTKDDSHLYGIKYNRIVYFNLETGIDESNFEPSDTTIDAFDLSDDENYIVGKDKKSIKVWDVSTGKIIKEKLFNIYNVHIGQEIYKLNISCNNEKLYLHSYISVINPLGNDYIIRTFVIYDFNSLDSIGSNRKEIYDYSLSNNCELLALSNQDDITKSPSITILNTTSNQVVNNFLVNEYPRSAKFTPDNKYLIANIYDGNSGIYMWNLKTSELTKIFEHGTYDVCTISNNQVYLVSSIANLLYLKNIAITTDIEKEDILFENLYPNPTNGEICIKIPDIIINEILLTNLNGQLIKSFEVNNVVFPNNEIRINSNSYPSGAYLLQVNGSAYQRVYKVIIAK